MSLLNNSLTKKNKNPVSLLQNEMNELIRRFNGDFGVFDLDLSSFLPRVEVKEKDKSYIIKAEVPGMKEDEINVTLQDNNLIIECERKSDKEDDKYGYYSSEFNYGSFYRSIPFSDEVNPETVKASCKSGILRVELDKVNPGSHKSKKIPILNS